MDQKPSTNSDWRQEEDKDYGKEDESSTFEKIKAFETESNLGMPLSIYYW